jgi:hypothetical protein
MLDQVVPKLLEGEFICEATAPSLFRALADEAFRSEVDAFLGKIKRWNDAANHFVSFRKAT